MTPFIDTGTRYYVIEEIGGRYRVLYIDHPEWGTFLRDKDEIRRE